MEVSMIVPIMDKDIILGLRVKDWGLRDQVSDLNTKNTKVPIYFICDNLIPVPDT